MALSQKTQPAATDPPSHRGTPAGGDSKKPIAIGGFLSPRISADLDALLIIISLGALRDAGFQRPAAEADQDTSADRFFGNGKVTRSVMPDNSDTSLAPNSFRRVTTSCTRISGAEAPAVTPMCLGSHDYRKARFQRRDDLACVVDRQGGLDHERKIVFI